MDTWNNIIRGSRDGEALIPFDPDNSLMIDTAVITDRDPIASQFLGVLTIYMMVTRR